LSGACKYDLELLLVLQCDMEYLSGTLRLIIPLIRLFKLFLQLMRQKRLLCDFHLAFMREVTFSFSQCF